MNTIEIKINGETKTIESLTKDDIETLMSEYVKKYEFDGTITNAMQMALQEEDNRCENRLNVAITELYDRIMKEVHELIGK